MDPITTIVTAVILGAASGITKATEQSVMATYKALKDALKKSYSTVDIEQVEKDPKSPARRALLTEELEHSGAGKDDQLVQLANDLIEAIENGNGIASDAVGINLEQLRARNISMLDIIADGSGIVGRDWEAEDDITIEGVRAGRGSNDTEKT